MKLNKRILIALCAGLLATGTGIGHAYNKRDIGLINHSSDTIENVYISPTSSGIWSVDRLRDSTLRGGHAVLFDFDGSGYTTCHFDVRLDFQSGESREYYDLNFCNVTAIVVTDDDAYTIQ